jgi:tetratricopeptide (TPR) repeat protein
MKTLVLGIVVAGIATGTVFYLRHTQPTPRGESQMSSPLDQRVQQSVLAHPLSHAEKAEPARQAPSAEAQNVQKALPASVAAPQPKTEASPALQQAIQTLISQASFDQKQAAWQQLKDAGKLDLAIAELEQHAASSPNAAEFPATLGQAYLQKAAMLKDIREQGILGMKADQSFDAALNLDPSNWEAGFWKATAMSYWPPQLNKGQEVIERFAELVKLQETQPAQPQFAQTYVLLGEQYQKQGYADYARQIWERGGALFPNDPKLVEKLSQPRPDQAAAR